MNKRNPDKTPLIGVSQCLLGDAVRYDGQSKANLVVIEQLSKQFRFVPVCPEVEAGLGVPRPPVQLTGNINKPKLSGRDDPTIDITPLMQRYCLAKVTTLQNIAGFILKSRSPSCGLNSTPIYINGHCVSETGRGIFARHLADTYPDLPVIEDCNLQNPNRLNEFIQLTRTQRDD